MMRRLAIVMMMCAAALATPLLTGAQTTDFTGKWVQDMEKSDPMGGGRMGGGGGGGRAPSGPQTVSITQTAAELTIERETQAGVQKMVYKLDGTESVNAGGRGGEVKSTSKWDGSKLVTKGSRSMTNQAGESMTIETEEVRSLEADGTMLVVTTTKSQMGEQTRKTVFKKG